MRKILLDFDQARTVGWIHQYLKTSMGFPDYYGNNLDALYDQLTSLTEDTCVGVFGLSGDKGQVSRYLRQVKRVMKDAEKDNPCLCVIFGEMEENYED